MKVQKLRLKRSKSIAYSIATDGFLYATEKGVSKRLKKLSLPDQEHFLYSIDEDGDLAREFRGKPEGIESAEPHESIPASSKLRARELHDLATGLLFPPTRISLAEELRDEDNRRASQKSRKIYIAELERLGGELEYALGPGVDVTLEDGCGVVWWVRGQPLVLWYQPESEWPFSIELRKGDPNHPEIARTRPPSKKKAS